MCLKVKKCLFAIGFAMQALVYLSASNLDHAINVINNNGKGGKLGDIGSLNLRPEEIEGSDYFLDNVTGDLYCFQHESNEWSPVCNVGMHHSRAAQEYNTIGKFVVKTPIYRPKKYFDNNKSQTNFLDEHSETMCYLKKLHIRHWLFQNCKMEFPVPHRGRWELHSFSFTNKEKTFEVLAESEGGPLVIEYPRMVAVKFMVNKRYRDTYEILNNFITKYANEIISSGKNQDMSILSYTHFTSKSTNLLRFNRGPEKDSSKLLKNYRPVNTPAKTNFTRTYKNPTLEANTNLDESELRVFKHSGLASNMKGKHILEHNYISADKVRYDSPSSLGPKSPYRFLSTDNIIGKYGLGKARLGNEDDLSFLEQPNIKKFDRSILKTSQIAERRGVKFSKSKVSIFDPRERESRFFKTNIEDDSLMTKADVRRQLFPELLEIEDSFEKRSWIPGQLTQGKIEVPQKAIRVTTGSPSYRKRGPVPKPSFSEYDFRTLRTSDPYKTYNQVLREYQKKEDEKIIGPHRLSVSRKTLDKDQSLLNNSRSINHFPKNFLF